MRRTKIVSTVGPAANTTDIMVQLIKAGADIFRFNFSHGDHEEQLGRFKKAHEAMQITGKRIGLMLDTKGAEIRSSDVKEDGKIHFNVGDKVRIGMDASIWTSKELIGVSYAGLYDDVHVGGHVLFDDGLLDMKILEKDDSKRELVAVVENAGDLGGKKGVNAPGVEINLPGLTEKDRDDITWGLQQGFNYISASFVRKPSDVQDIRDLVDAGPNPHVMIIPKIESQEGINNADAILAVSDGLMVARGDMGVEIPFEMVPQVQKSLIRKANMAHKPVITATQMLNSMQENPRPTRAEVADVANSIYDGTDATMLSGESANGKYPVGSVAAMARIDEATDEDLPQHSVIMDAFNANDSITDTLGYSVVSAAERVGAKVIVAVTANGFTARSIARFRPNIPIIALTFTNEVADSLILSWGTTPIVIDDTENINEIYATAEKVAVSEGLLEKGDRMVITLGIPFGKSHHTNNMYVREIGED